MAKSPPDSISEGLKNLLIELKSRVLFSSFSPMVMNSYARKNTFVLGL